ncbi:tryptophan-rich sensory protein [Dysgonomonas sp. 216]|uniref:TspO/MBR family protein n=1 Tax=Dysgonomonas sp. 216 TaxID=2302934 RepID=UPI0013D062E8|nr:TspO/MBR family protein [Dysgonomonas sp. 216]NDW19276.1 tryptophan-rich sensory protein [Dysgonomonas sp. 216]
MRRILVLILIICFCFFVGFLASKVQAESLANWYPLLNKSSLTPPNYIFPIVWNILYLCMGLSIGYILTRRNPKEMILFGLFSLQLALNFLWSITFFYMQNPLFGLINITLLLVVIGAYLIASFKWANRFSFAMFIPYFLWVLFAGYLNLYIVLYN